MTRPSTRSGAVRLGRTAVVCAAVAALTACSGSGDAEQASGEATAGPLETMFAELLGNWDSAAQRAMQMEVEEATARCMAEQGFEYIPVDYSELMVASTVEEEDTNTREWAEKYGFGYSIQPEYAGEDAFADFVDPNEEYVASMSESESTAYYEALYGAMDFDWEDPEAVPDMADMGCSGWAQTEVMGDQTEAFESEEMNSFYDDMEQLESDINADPRVAQVNTEWSACMAEAGLGNYANPVELQDDFMERSSAAWEDLDPEAEFPEPDPEVQEAERAAAVADFDCREKVGFDKAQREVRFTLEQEYIDTHQDLLEAVKAAYESLGF